MRSYDSDEKVTLRMYFSNSPLGRAHVILTVPEFVLLAVSFCGGYGGRYVTRLRPFRILLFFYFYFVNMLDTFHNFDF